MIDGEMQADTAVSPHIVEDTYPFSTLKGGANVLIFPLLSNPGNIAYQLLHRIGGGGIRSGRCSRVSPSRCTCCNVARGAQTSCTWRLWP